MGLFNKNRVKRCEKNQDGTMYCLIGKRDKDGNIVATGTNLDIGADPANGCKPFFPGRYQVVEGDEDLVEELAKKVVSGCKAGL